MTAFALMPNLTRWIGESLGVLLTGSQATSDIARHSEGGSRNRSFASVRTFFTGSRPRLRRGGAGPRDGAPRCGRRWRAVLAHPTAPHAHNEESGALDQFQDTALNSCSQLRLLR